MNERLDDQMVRIAAFHYLDKLQQLHGDVLPWTALPYGDAIGDDGLLSYDRPPHRRRSGMNLVTYLSADVAPISSNN